MTPNETKLVKQALKPFVDSGLISSATLSQLTAIKDDDGRPPRPNLVDRKETSKVLGCCIQSLVNFEKAGRLKPIKLAGRRAVRYTMQNIEQLLDCKEVANA